MRPLLPGLAALFLLASPVAAQEAADFRADALAVEGLVEAQYAYLERLPGGRFPDSGVLRAEAAAVQEQSPVKSSDVEEADEVIAKAETD